MPTDRGRDHSVNSQKSIGKPTGVGVIFVPLFLLVCAYVIPWQAHLWPLWVTLGGVLLAMVFGFLDDRSLMPWGEYLKGAIDLLISFGIACAIGGCPKQGPPIYSYTPTATYGGSESSSGGCSSDYQCGYGSRCVKAPAAGHGICLKSEDPLRSPSSKSIGPGSLRLGCGGLCPIGYHCDAKLQACVK